MKGLKPINVLTGLSLVLIVMLVLTSIGLSIIEQTNSASTGCSALSSLFSDMFGSLMSFTEC